MWPDWVSNPGPLTYESGVLPIALHGPAPVTGLVIQTDLTGQDTISVSPFYKRFFVTSVSS